MVASPLSTRAIAGTLTAALVTVASALACSGDGATGPGFGPPSVAQPFSGADQTVIAGSTAAAPLVVEVLDSRGRAVGGETVTWSVVAGGGTVAPTTSLTNVDGQARTFLRAGSVGTQTVHALVAGVSPAAFTVQATPEPATALTVTQGNAQQGVVGATLAVPIVVRATSASGTPVAGVVVTFAPNAGTVAPTSAATNASGEAVATWTLPNAVGSHSLVASASGLSPVTVTANAISNVVPTTLLKVAGDGQSGTVAAALGDSISVRLLLADGSPAAGRTVLFYALGGAGSLSPSSVATDSLGVARARWVLGTTSGVQQAAAAATGVAAIQFTATASAAVATQIVLVSGNAQASPAGSPLPLPLVVETRDQYGNASGGATVNFSAAAGSGTFSPASAVTATNGRASTEWTLAAPNGAKSGTAALVGGGSVPLSATVTPPLSVLSHRVIDAEHSSVTDRIVTVSAGPNRLHILDPETGTGPSVALALPPLAVSISPDGAQAVVGHDAWVTVVNLLTATVVTVHPVTSDVIDVVHGGNGFAYVFPRTDQWQHIRTINLATGAETASGGWSIYAGTVARLHPSGRYMYGADRGLSPSDFEKYDIRNGTATVMYDSPYHGDHPFNGDVWPSEDGLRLFAKSGAVFRSSEVPAEDMLYAGSLSGLSSVQWVTQSTAANRIFAIRAPDWNASLGGTELRVYSAQFMAFLGTVPLPSFPVPGVGTYAGDGRFVFHRADGQRVYILVRADAASGLQNDWALAQYAIAELP
jgi:hypothetical protein